MNFFHEKYFKNIAFTLEDLIRKGKEYFLNRMVNPSETKNSFFFSRLRNTTKSSIIFF